MASLLLIGATCSSAQTVRYEAEDARLEGPTVRAILPAADAAAPATEVRPGQRLGYSGTGYVTGMVDKADRIVFAVQAPTAGVYDVRLGYASESYRGYLLEVNGLRISDTFGASANRGFAEHAAGRIELLEGANVVAIGRGWGFYDVDYLDVTPAVLTPPVKVSTPPSDPHATAGAQALLARVNAGFGGATMLGVYTDKDAQYVADTVGVRPSIMGGDLMRYSPTSVKHTKSVPEVERLIARSAEGYTITLSWHWLSPFGLVDAMVPDPRGGTAKDERWYRSFYTEATTFDVSRVTDIASPERAAMLWEIDQIAVQLRRLDKAGVPVLWRPLHEAEGKWFWWGAKGPEPFKALWRMMYDRLVGVDGVHNLVWVYTSGGDPAWYPGDAYVDVVGIDAYPEDIRDPQTALWAQLEQQFAGRKPLAISEFGGVPDIPRAQRLGAGWAYAVSWSAELGPRKNSVEELKRIYAAPGVVTLPIAPVVPGAPAAAGVGE